MCKKITIKLIKFIRDLILWLIAWALTPIVEIATFIVVIFKYKLGALNYFKGEGYSFDVRSASRNRSLWNFLFINKNGIRFYTVEDISISAYLGLNARVNKLTLMGWFMYYLLYIIDFTAWKSGGHCEYACKDIEIRIEDGKYPRYKVLFKYNPDY